VDTGVVFPLAMSESGWKKAGVDPKGFESVAGDPGLKQGVVPRLVLGGFDMPRVPAVSGLPLGDLEQGGGIRLDGVIGSALVAEFRSSLVDQGRTMWLEEMPSASVRREDADLAQPESGSPQLPPASGPSPGAPPARTSPGSAPAPSVPPATAPPASRTPAPKPPASGPATTPAARP
jgi:hypothetical protein